MPTIAQYVPTALKVLGGGADPAVVAYVALVAEPADVAYVALVAEEAAPLKVAVIVPALKLPEASRATTLLAVLVVVASTANVRAVDPLKVPPLVRYVPAVKAAAVAFAVVAVVANVAKVARVALVAEPALVALVAVVAKVALVADEAKVALVAEDAAPLKVAVIVPALKLPEASRATMVLAVFRLVALLVTVYVALVAWLAVNVCDPERPVPDTFIVNVPFWTLLAVVAVVAKVARVASVAVVASVALVADEAKVALVAEAAEPVVFWLKVGQVNVPVLKLPDVGVPRAGVVKLGEVAKATTVPEPVVLYEVPHAVPVEFGIPAPG